MPRFLKEERVRTGRDWAAARKARHRAATDALVVCFAASARRRLGLVVGGHVGPAVERNRFKRVVREYFRLHKDEFPAGDSIVIAKPAAARLDNKGVVDHLKRAVAKIQKIL